MRWLWNKTFDVNRTSFPMVVEVLQGNTIHNHYVTVTK
ncbi:hypothetical protein L829_3176 [Mycobacteroides abscessus MAB_030201_1075]|uniref:Uncharacterized protein n=2 Tax=Mycobacteroides abscessus TaxID=36809 RepID=A0A829PQV9_9MYCO|nr:hypothetical protein L835_0294 [Mycobacteroides abscessus MAB_110811_1470]ETZ89599.1 hypothetical protein L829_3176 [Mycobacteroides abscessus MAB_030201_1075]ETZ96115.1 hypothetical protein L828_0304 [Mycobacteroides abscessus MAB_030201_1061]EUA46724.1 hypothetical protein I543_2777 [Mycobacteroides abscessus 21]